MSAPALPHIDLDVLPRHRLRLPATQPFDLGQSLRVLRGSAPCTGEQVVGEHGVRKALTLAGPAGDEAVVVDITAAGDGVLVETVAARPLDDTEQAAVGRAVSSWLSLDDDLRPFLAAAADDPALRPLLDVTHGLHQVRFPSLAEGAVYFVLTQRTSQALAGARKRRVSAAHGPRLVVDGEEHVAFPSLTALAALPPGELGRFGGNRQQADYLEHVVRGLAELGAEPLRTRPYAEAAATLRALRGVGEFTASAILMRVLGRPDSASLEMRQFRDVVEAVYGPGTPSSVVRDRYGQYVGWWAYYARIGLGWLGTPPG